MRRRSVDLAESGIERTREVRIDKLKSLPFAQPVRTLLARGVPPALSGPRRVPAGVRYDDEGTFPGRRVVRTERVREMVTHAVHVSPAVPRAEHHFVGVRRV